MEDRECPSPASGPSSSSWSASPATASPARSRRRWRSSVDQGLVRIIDLAVVSKDGTAASRSSRCRSWAPRSRRPSSRSRAPSAACCREADLEEIAEELEPDSTAAALLFEHVWATRFAGAVRAANGELLLSERIPHAVVAEARASLLAAAG